VLRPAWSSADIETGCKPENPAGKVSDNVKVRRLPETDLEVPAPFTMHWPFCIDPPPGVSGPAHAVLVSFNSEIVFDGWW
jgi:hypothetical protein